MKIAVVTNEPFPVGMAATNRLRSYCKGLVEEGHKVNVLVLRPTEKPGKVFNTKVQGTIDGIGYRYTSGSTLKSSSFLCRRMDNTRGLLRAALQIIRHNSHPDALILVSNVTLVMLFFRLVTWLANIPYVQEKSEFPLSIRRGDTSLRARLYLAWAYRLFDGMICMTGALDRYFTGRMCPRAQRIVVPMTVDVSRFENVTPHPVDYPYIAYCGFMGGDKDGVPILVDAFAQIANDFPDMRLVLIGDAGSEQAMQSLQSHIDSLNLSERIMCTGRIPRDDIPAWLAGANALALARPDNKQAAGGFPTKLGEYLASARPVVVTAVGEIPDYLEDGVHAYLMKPGSADDFADGLSRALSDTTAAAIMALTGRQLALDRFHYRPQAVRIADFLDSLTTRKD